MSRAPAALSLTIENGVVLVIYLPTKLLCTCAELAHRDTSRTVDEHINHFLRSLSLPLRARARGTPTCSTRPVTLEIWWFRHPACPPTPAPWRTPRLRPTRRAIAEAASLSASWPR